MCFPADEPPFADREIARPCAHADRPIHRQSSGMPYIWIVKTALVQDVFCVVIVEGYTRVRSRLELGAIGNQIYPRVPSVLPSP